MQYRIETMKAFELVGKSKQISMVQDQNFMTIPEFWEEVCSDGSCEKIFGINHREKEEMYGVCYDFRMEEKLFRYMIAAKPETKIPDDLERIHVPESLWAKFKCVGEKEIQIVTQKIFNEWLPNSEYEHADAPEIEWYSTGDVAADDFDCEVWLPIRKKK